MKHLKKILLCTTVIGSMADMPQRLVAIDEAERWAVDHDTFYFDMSSKTTGRPTVIAKLIEIGAKIDLL